MVKNYEEESFKVISRFIALHLTPERLMKIGAFVVCYGQFETTLERALWTLREIDVGNDSNLLIVFYVQIMPDDFVMQLHR
ncbi:hypothetical protein, partial [Escherichia coli]|uniref:hypothetical protein n=2 Tax=Escherichia coli TaxID=562 RepID=UPI001F498088